MNCEIIYVPTPVHICEPYMDINQSIYGLMKSYARVLFKPYMNSIFKPYMGPYVI